jgi:hypothetical protein
MVVEDGAGMRTRLSVCARKIRFASEEAALAWARGLDLPLRPYQCDRCRRFHLTSRTKGKRVPSPRPEADDPQSP